MAQIKIPGGDFEAEAMFCIKALNYYLKHPNSGDASAPETIRRLKQDIASDDVSIFLTDVRPPSSESEGLGEYDLISNDASDHKRYFRVVCDRNLQVKAVIKEDSKKLSKESKATFREMLDEEKRTSPRPNSS